MDKGLERLDDRISELGAIIQATENRRKDVQTRLAGIRAEIPGVMAAIQAALLSGDDLVSLDAKRQQLRDGMEKGEILVSGLTEKLEALENELSSVIQQRNTRFGALAAKWLKREVFAYNDLAAKLSGVIRRLAACREMLWEVGQREPYQESLGPGWKYLTETRVLTLGDGFETSDLTAQKALQLFRPGPQIHQDVFREVTNGV